MQRLREVSLQELLGLCRYRLAKGKEAFTIYLPPTKIPPTKPFKRVELEDKVVGVRYQIYVRSAERDGGWLIRVRVKETEPFNTIPIGEAMQRK